jgi:uncharacterized surface protein with fasciclin (FAS1) repeats
METTGYRKQWYSIPFKLGVLLAIMTFLVQCGDDVIEWELKSTEMVITDYVYNNPEQFSEFGNLLEYTGIENLLRVRGPFTLLLPTDEAMRAYYESKNVSSYTELDKEMLEDLVYNHLFQGEITAGSIGQGALLYKNGLGDYVASEFSGIEILINKTAIIIKRDIPTSNGYVHHIDHVLEPVTGSVVEELATYPGYSIFLDGLEVTGLSDTLNIIEFPYGSATARTRYTLLAVPDTLYQRHGINSIDDLIDRYSNSEDLTALENGLYKYMVYHCLNETYYFNDLAPNDIYYLITFDNNLNIKVDDDYRINSTDSSFTGFYYELSNIPAKNGAIHTVNTLLENKPPDPQTIIFQTTDFFDLQQGPYYLNYYQRFYDGENSFEFIKWEGEFMLYYLKPSHNLMDDDCLNMNGHFEIEITTQKIPKGDYELSGFFFMGGGYPEMAVYVDGERIGNVDLEDGTWGGSPLKFGDVSFTETERHTIRLVSVRPGGLFWDYVRFKPKV